MENPAGIKPPQVTKPMFDKVPPSTLRLKRRSKSVSDLKKIPEQTKPKVKLTLFITIIVGNTECFFFLYFMLCIYRLFVY